MRYIGKKVEEELSCSNIDIKAPFGGDTGEIMKIPREDRRSPSRY